MMAPVWRLPFGAEGHRGWNLKLLTLVVTLLVCWLGAEAHGEHVCQTPVIKPGELLFTKANVSNWAKRRTSGGYPNIRITVNFDSSITDLPNREEVKIYTDRAIDFWKRSLLVKYPLQQSTLLARSCVGQPIIATVDGVERSCCIRVRNTTCLPQTVCAGAEVPSKYQPACCWCERNDPSTCRVEGTDGEGLKDTDFLMLAIAKPVLSCAIPNVLAYAAPCYLDDNYWRPIVGVVNLCSGIVNHTTGLDRYSEIQVLKHEIAHALGFNAGLYAYFRDEDGNPISPVDPETGYPVQNGSQGFIVSEKVVRKVTRPWQSAAGTFNREFTYVVTPTLRKELQDHFNCPSLEGAELEDNGGSGTAGSHLEKRIFPSEAMSGVLTEWMNMSRVSLAFMQDTGWYMANFSNAEPYTYGEGLGCAFAQDSCYLWIKNARAAGRNPAPYCDVLSTPTNSAVREQRGTCTSKHDQVAVCTLTVQRAEVDPMYQYFDSVVPNGSPSDNVSLYGGFDVADYCPYLILQNIAPRDPKANSNRYRMCKSILAQTDLQYDSLLETYGSSSICLRQATPVRQYSCVNDTQSVVSDASAWGAGCYEVLCESTGVRVKAQGYTLHVCTEEYSQFNFDVKTPGSIYQGSLICPSCADACGTKECPMRKRDASTVNDELLLELSTAQPRPLVSFGAPALGACYSAVSTPKEIVSATVHVNASTPTSSLETDLPYVLFGMCGASPSTCLSSSPSLRSSSSVRSDDWTVSASNYKVQKLQQVAAGVNQQQITFYVTFSDKAGVTEEVPKQVSKSASSELPYVLRVDDNPVVTDAPVTNAPVSSTPVVTSLPEVITSHHVPLGPDYESLMWVFIGLTIAAVAVIIAMVVYYKKKGKVAPAEKDTELEVRSA